MKKLLVMLGIVTLGVITPVQKTQAQILIAEIIKAGVKKVVRAVDLKIQRLQNKTIWLQNAQKVLENTMSKLKLDEISTWVERQRTLYKDYYEELYKVKSIISYYNRIKDISRKQGRLVKEYQRAWNLLKQDKNFTPEELDYMSRVYSGILDQSTENIGRISLVINSFTTQMSDAERLEIINAAAEQVDTNYYDLVKFNQQSILLSLQRAKAHNDIDVVKKLYGIE
ncbi:conjugal transfer protein TraI [Rubrolithibacter danxiaensis]|uniref:conjugal transfer protein TraI n=1 Tax=Rubrolithibacter danxiaensis TaxID=3390805 RepID=UPI003BF7F8E9